MSGTEKRMVWLDALRLMAGVSMVGLHSSSDSSGQPFVDWSVADRIPPVLFRTVIYTARTELFLIISLFLLTMAMDRRPRSYGVMVAEQFRRLMVPFLFWTLFYSIWRLIKAYHFGYADSLIADMSTAEGWVGYVLLGDVLFHMHFLPTLFGLVLLFPLYRAAARYPWLGLTILVCLMVKREADVFLWQHFQSEPWFDYALRGLKILTYAGYGFVGAAFWGMMRAGLDTRRHDGLLPSLLFAGGLLFGLKLITAWRIIHYGDWQFGYLPGFWADFLMPAVLFALAFMSGHRHWPEIFSRLAPYSFGIYLVHPMVLSIAEIILDGRGLVPWQLVAAKVVIALSGASLISVALSRSRLLAWTIGLGPLPFDLPPLRPLRRRDA